MKKSTSACRRCAAVFGIGYRRELLATPGGSLDLQIGHRFSMMDYRVSNKDLGAGMHAWTFLVTIGDRTLFITSRRRADRPIA